MTQKHLEQLADVNQSHISAILRGQVQPTVPVLERLASALGMRLIVTYNTAKQLIVDVDNPPPDHVAYCEDAYDRLWTGRGHGLWTCLHGGSRSGKSWSSLWKACGPMTPLGPITAYQSKPQSFIIHVGFDESAQPIVDIEQ